MFLMLLGVLAWSFLHLLSAIAPKARHAVLAALGKRPYQAFFSLSIVLSLLFIVLGWRSSPSDLLYQPSPLAAPVTMLASLLACLGFAAAHSRCNIRHWLRHPQLIGFLCWTIGHLLSNGELRAVLLFSSLTLWAILEIVFINRRDGRWLRPAKVTMAADIMLLLKASAVFVVLILLHPWLAGVPLVPPLPFF